MSENDDQVALALREARLNREAIMSEPATELKTCSTCKHYRSMFPYPPKCAAIVNPVTGGPGAYCHTERVLHAGGLCGMEGRLWEPAVKHPWWAFWRSWV